MKPPSLRRHNRWHERLLLSHTFTICLGWSLTVILPYILFWSWSSLWQPDEGQQTALVVTSLAFLVTQLVMIKMRSLHPGKNILEFITPTILTIYGLFALLTLFSYLSVSRYLLVSSCICALMWTIIYHLILSKHTTLKFAIIPGGQYTTEISALTRAHLLSTLSLGNTRYDGVVADFEHSDAATQRFLTQCALNHTAIYDERDVYESLTGRVKIYRMSENKMGSLLLSPLYELIKYCADMVIIVTTSPITILISIVVALLIKLESPGPILYTQTRVGKGNRLFTLYKFRSMRQTGDTVAQFASVTDPRITRVGRIIRKMRIDELPQFINILKGDMSLIGPRPEQPDFVAEYEKKIPFYSYRHIIRPGITGWAQVRHGYTASSDETIVKLEHDFYYIKHCSFSLDFIVLLMTLRIVVNGFGAR